MPNWDFHLLGLSSLYLGSQGFEWMQIGLVNILSLPQKGVQESNLCLETAGALRSDWEKILCEGYSWGFGLIKKTLWLEKRGVTSPAGDGLSLLWPLVALSQPLPPGLQFSPVSQSTAHSKAIPIPQENGWAQPHCSGPDSEYSFGIFSITVVSRFHFILRFCSPHKVLKTELGACKKKRVWGDD